MDSHGGTPCHRIVNYELKIFVCSLGHLFSRLKAFSFPSNCSCRLLLCIGGRTENSQYLADWVKRANVAVYVGPETKMIRM